jgi:hypothetical protein
MGAKGEQECRAASCIFIEHIGRQLPVRGLDANDAPVVQESSNIELRAKSREEVIARFF